MSIVLIDIVLMGTVLIDIVLIDIVLIDIVLMNHFDIVLMSQSSPIPWHIHPVF